MEKVKNTAWAVTGFLLFLFSTMMFLDEVRNFQKTIQSEQTSPVEVAITGKQVERSYLGKNHYLVMLSKGNEEKVSMKQTIGTYSEVSKEEYETLKPGDKIQGVIKGRVFYTQLDGKEAHKEHWIMLVVTVIFPIMYLIYQLSKLIVYLRVRNPFSKSFGTILKIILSVGLGSLLLAGYGLMFSDLFRWISENVGDQTYRIAEITDSRIDIGHGRYAETNYYLAFNFSVDGESFHMTKEVSAYDYKKNFKLVQIRYPVGHPDQVSIGGYHWRDALHLISYSWFGIYFCVIIITGLLIFAAVKIKQKKRAIEESRKQSRRKFRKR
ncbi:hypothetical protein M3197_15560 [Sporosarcina aquimarina]|uniref:hypothetical protein n=1 Tax=Sporosarcina aquimarina TaxID=114975 RepID=UPI00203A4302|nr:hypothetical protein [Sporosarcina aquimarina]MCM3758857.1 hypothetical protein [Sporosarcina aquimarina]